MTARLHVCTVTSMVSVVVHEQSALFLGRGFVLVDRRRALEFEDAAAAQTFLDRHACEPGFAALPVARRSGAALVSANNADDRIDVCRTA